MVGATLARDLRDTGSLLVIDADDNALKPLAAEGLETRRADLTDPATLRALAGEADLVVGAVPGCLGHRVFLEVIESGTSLVDISFFPEDPLASDDLARRRDVTALVDCGVAPGLCNLWLGETLREMTVQSYSCDVGGLPFDRTPPWEYKAPFSPGDVIEEYLRPARHKTGGALVTKEALGGLATATFDVGTLEAFDTDGLRTLLTTVDVPEMSERTLRWPGHRDRIQLLRDSGFFDTGRVGIADGVLTPLEMTESLLRRQWALQPGDREFTVMRVVIEGTKNGTPIRRTYDLFDETAPDGTRSMARTTGYTCTAIVRLLLSGADIPTGVLAPEHLGLAGHTPVLREDLARHGVTWFVRDDPLEDA